MPEPRKHAIKPAGTDWRAELAARKSQWTSRNDDLVLQAIEDDVYDRSRRGARMSYLARLYGVTRDEFRAAVGDVWALANAEFQNEHIEKATADGLASKQPVLRIWGNKIALEMDGARTPETESEVSDGTVTVNVTLAKRPDAE